MSNIKTVMHPYIPAMVNHLECWLTHMSTNGWALTKVNGWKFIFEKTLPKEREYFIYSGFDASKGISFDYHMAKKKYNKTNSRLSQTTLGIFEVDLIKKDQNYSQYKELRNKYYRKHYIKLIIFCCIFSILSFWGVVLEKAMGFLLSIWLMILVYSIISFLFIRRNVYNR